MKIPSPGELGLPPKFDCWRGNQAHAIDVIVTSQKRVVGVEAPTGFGKSAVYVAAALLLGKRTCIVTNSRGLQDQLIGDFGPIGLVDIRGRANYQCDLKPDYTCQEGYVSRCPFKGSVGCPASAAEMRAQRSMYVVTNYDKWTSSRKFGTGMEGFEVVIFDEAHDMPDALARAMQVVLNHREIEEELGVPFLVGEAALEFANWKPWASEARALAEIEYIQAQARIAGVSDPKPSWVRKVTHMRNLMRRLATISQASAKDWIVDEKEAGYQFDPIRPGKYGESALYMRVPRIIATSATLRPKTMFMTGMGRDKFDFYEFDSDFDPRRCPIYWIPTQRVDSKHPDMRNVWMRLDQILARRRDRKGIIHSVSHDRRSEITNASRFGEDMLFNEKGEPITATIDTFKASDPPTLLVTPSAVTGYDFPGATCEFQFMVKIPFQPPSKIVRAREQDDKEYRSYQAMQSLVQAFGRGMRSKEDRCENFIPDDNLEWFLPYYGHLAPRSFHGFFRKVTTLPPPPEKL